MLYLYYRAQVKHTYRSGCEQFSLGMLSAQIVTRKTDWQWGLWRKSCWVSQLQRVFFNAFSTKNKILVRAIMLGSPQMLQKARKPQYIKLKVSEWLDTTKWDNVFLWFGWIKHVNKYKYLIPIDNSPLKSHFCSNMVQSGWNLLPINFCVERGERHPVMNRPASFTSRRTCRRVSNVQPVQERGWEILPHTRHAGPTV